MSDKGESAIIPSIMKERGYDLDMDEGDSTNEDVPPLSYTLLSYILKWIRHSLFLQE